MIFKKLSLLTLAALLFLTAGKAFAVTKTYSGLTGGNWNVAGNWSPSGVPLNGDDVIIPTGFLVIANFTDQVTSLTIETGASFLISTGITITVTGSTTVQSNGTLEFGTTAVMNGSGSFTLSAGGTIITANAGGIASSGASGSVQMTTRNFSSAANYEFRNAITGVFTTAPTALTVNNLTVTRTGTTTLSQAFTVNGTLTMNSGTIAVGTLTLKLNGPVVQTSGTFSSSTTGTVNYAQGIAGQNIATGSYGHLTLSNFDKIFPSGTVNMSGTFTPGTATAHTITGCTFNFNGAAGQAIPAFNYYSLSSSNSNRTLAASGTIGIENIFTPGSGTYTITGSNIEFNGAGAQNIPSIGGGYNNLKTTNGGKKTLSANVSVGGILTIDTGTELDLSIRTLTLSGTGTPLIADGTFTPATGTVSFTGTGQTIPALNYYNLTSSSIARTLANTGTIGVSGTFTPGTGVHTITGSTVEFNGSANQLIPAITPNYENLATSNSGTKSLNASETVAGILTIGAGTTFDLLTRVLTLTGSGVNIVVNGTFTASTGTVAFNGVSNQTIPALDYYTLTSTNGDRTLETGIISISNGFTPGSGNYTTTGSTINFNGSGAQNIPALTPAYNNITTSVGGIKSLSASPINVDGVLTIGTGTALNASSRTLNLNGNGTPLVIAGTFTYATSTVAYNGTANQDIAATDYYTLISTDNDRTLPSSGSVGIFNSYTPGTGNYTVTGSEVIFKRTTTQTIPAGTYNNITSLNFARTLAASGTIFIEGAFTPGSGTYTTTNSTVNFSGAGNQTIPAFTSGQYFNLNTSNGGTKTMSANLTTAGTINVGAGTILDLQSILLTLSAETPLTVDGAIEPSNSTVHYSRSSSQTIAAANYYNLTSTNFARILQSDGTIDIANTFTPGSAGYTTTGSTVNFSSGSAQAVPAAINFYNLSFSGAGTKTVSAASSTQFKTNQTLSISAPVAYSNISSIYIVKNFSGNATINPGALDITIGGDWLNTATGYSVTGNVTYTGETDVTLNIGGVNYTNLNITASRGASFPVNTAVPSPMTIGGKLTISDYTTFTTNGNVTLLSSASSFANIAPLTGTANISGNVKVQTWFTGGANKRGTRMLTPTIVETSLAPGNKFYQQLKANMVITGPGGVTNGFDAGNALAPFAVTLTKYNEAATLATSQFTAVSNLSNGILPGDGFFLFFRGDRTGYNSGDPNASAVLLTGYVPESFASMVDGPVAQGTINVPINNSDHVGDSNNGYNVVGNPYVSTIDWEKVYTTNAADVANEIRIIQPGGAVMSRKVVLGVPTIINAGDNLAAQYIQPGQGFYIRKTTTGPGTLTFNEAHKEVAGTPDRLLVGPAQRNTFQVSMSATPALMTAGPNDYYQMYLSLSDGVNRDEAAIVFKEGFDANFDEIDAPYLSGSTVILSSFSADGKANAINYMPALNTVSQVRLNVNAAASGPLTLNFSNIATFAGFKVTLQDTYLNTLTDVKANPLYNFSIDRTTAGSFGASRFVLLFEGTIPLQLNLAAFTAAQQNTGVLLNWATANEQSSVRIEIERSADNTTFTKIGEKTGAGTTTAATVYSFTDTTPLNGVNHYRLKQVYTDGTFSYSEIRSVTYTKPGYTPPKITFKLYPNPADNMINIDVTGIRSKLIIYDLFGRIVKTDTFEVGEPVKMNISSLRTGIYFAELKDLSTKRPTDIIIFFKR